MEIKCNLLSIFFIYILKYLIFQKKGKNSIKLNKWNMNTPFKSIGNLKKVLITERI
jgi:hypothetical protein